MKFVQSKTGHNTDKGPAWISVVSFDRSWKTAGWHGNTHHRWTGIFDANFYDIEIEEQYWISGRTATANTRYSSVKPTIDDDARAAYEAFLAGASLPGRERG